MCITFRFCFLEVPECGHGYCNECLKKCHGCPSCRGNLSKETLDQLRPSTPDNNAYNTALNTFSKTIKTKELQNKVYELLERENNNNNVCKKLKTIDQESEHELRPDIKN